MSDCALCNDPESYRHVEAIMRNEKTHGDIGAVYGVAASVVAGHIKNHVALALRPGIRKIAMNPDAQKRLMEAKEVAILVLIDKMAAMNDLLEELLCDIRDDTGKIHFSPKHITAITNVANTLRGYLREVGVWTGDVKEGATILNVHIQFVHFKTVVLEVLKEHPEVLAKVEARLVEETGVQR